MPYDQPFEVLAFHGCDQSVGLRVLTGKMELWPSDNSWDWLGRGIYFWEQNPTRALRYAEESAAGRQFNKTPVRLPFVLGALIELRNCLNLIEPGSITVLSESYENLKEFFERLGLALPINKEHNRALYCIVINFTNGVRSIKGQDPFDTVRSPFAEGGAIYPGSAFSRQGHIQICVINPNVIRAYFLPRPIGQFNPYLYSASLS